MYADLFNIPHLLCVMQLMGPKRPHTHDDAEKPSSSESPPRRLPTGAVLVIVMDEETLYDSRTHSLLYHTTTVTPAGQLHPWDRTACLGFSCSSAPGLTSRPFYHFTERKNTWRLFATTKSPDEGLDSICPVWVSSSLAAPLLLSAALLSVFPFEPYIRGNVPWWMPFMPF